MMMSGLVLGEGFEPRGAVFGLVDVARAEAVQQGAHDAPHVRVVIDDKEAQPIEIDADHNNPVRRGSQRSLKASTVIYCC
jgi:hypothetical protein